MIRAFLASAPRAVLASATLLCIAYGPLSSAATRASVTISGSPPTTVNVGTGYSFTPSVSPDNSRTRFFISNKPAWAAFDPRSGKLSGTPSTAGTYGNIRIAVMEGREFASLAPFSITVNNAAGSTGSGSGTGSTSKPTISGSPATAVTAGSPYSFTPTAKDTNSASKLTFSVQNPPSWASFNATTGTLSGTPTSANVGTYSNIVISVSDGQASASLSPFSVAVNNATVSGSAEVTWLPPTQNTDGSPLTTLSGYQINYGTSSTNLSNTISISNPGLASYVVTNLATGTWYFDVVAVTSDGEQSAASNLGSKTIN